MNDFILKSSFLSASPLSELYVWLLTYCYSLNLKCLSNAQVLKAYSPQPMVLLGGSEDFKRWSLMEELMSLEAYLWRGYWDLGPFSLLLLSGHHEVSSFLHHMLPNMMCPCAQAQRQWGQETTRNWNLWNHEPQQAFPSCGLIIWGIMSPWWKLTNTHTVLPNIVIDPHKLRNTEPTENKIHHNHFSRPCSWAHCHELHFRTLRILRVLPWLPL